MSSNSGQSALDKLQARCLARDVTGIMEFGRTFRIWDDNSDHTLNLAEFMKGLQDYGANLTPDEAKNLFKFIDKDASGLIVFDELLIELRNRTNLIEAAFRKLDKSGDGFITPADLKGVYNVRNHPKYLNGEKTEEEIFLEFLRTFDSPDGDSKVTQEEFLNYYAGVSASIDSDAYFDLMMRQAWKL